MVCRDRRMDRAARLRVNQGEAEGVYDCTRPRMSPQICPQDCPRGAAAGRFLWDSCVYTKNSCTVMQEFLVFRQKRQPRRASKPSSCLVSSAGSLAPNLA